MPSNTHTIIGGTKRFECRVIGHPRPEIRWFKDGRDITHNTRYSFDHTYEGVISMIMENIGHKDEGHYRCRAENSEGIASTSAYLTVKAHKEHPDEEIEEVHTMELDEHIVYKTNRDHTIITEFPRDSKLDMEAARRRTFEQIVDEEKENVREILNGTVSKEFSSKKSSESSTIIESVNEKSYSKKTLEKYDETIECSSKRSLIISEEKTSLSFQSEIESAGTKKSKEKSLSEFSSMEETKVKADLAEKEMVMKVSVETEQSSSSQSKSDRLTASIDSEINEKNKKQGLSVEVTEAETSSMAAKRSAKEQGLSVEVTETEISSMAAKKSAKEQGLSVEVTEAETSSRLAKEQELSVEVTETEISSVAAKKSAKEQGLSVEVTEVDTSSRLAKESANEQGLSVEVTETETSSKAAKESANEQGLSVEVAETEISSEAAKKSVKEQGLSVEVTETETSSRETKESAKDLITSVSTEEISTESSRKDEEKQQKMKVEVEVEEVPAECRMELERQDEEDDSAKSVTDSAPTSLCNDSGFMESSMLDSTQFQTDSMVDSAMDSSAVDTSATESETDSKTKTDSKSTSLKKEISVEESRVEESTTSETSEITSLVEKSEKLQSEENVSAVASTTSVTRQTSLVGAITEEEFAESTTKTTSEITSLAEKSEKLKSEEDVSAAASAASVARQTSLVEEVTEEEPAESTTKTSTDEEVKAAEEVIRRESTSVSQEISHADETVENISGGDITGLLDERPDPTTVVEEEVVVAEAEEEEQQEQRARWVDQITSRTEALTMEGEGKKVEELTPEEAAVATQTQVDQVELSRTTSEKSPETSVNAENLTARQSSVVDDLSQDEEQMATVNTQASSKDQRRGYEDRLEVDEDLSAQNVLGLQKAPRSTFDEIGSSVDSVSQAGKEADAEPEVKKDEGLTVKAEVSTEESQKVTSDDDGLTLKAEVTTEESKKVTKDDEELRVSAEVSVSEREAQAGEARSAPRLVAVPEDVSVQLGQTIRLESQVQGNPQPEVKWFKSGDSLKAGERVTLHTDSDVFSLEIREAEEGDGGTYTLTAHNSEGTIFSDAVVTVTIPPSLGAPDEDITLRARVSVPEIVAQPGKVTVKEFGALELVCTIRGTPTPTVEWTTEGHTLQSDSHRSVFESEGQYYLTIPRVTAQDAGDYTCTASNSEGSVTCTISVFVESQGSSVSEDGAAAMVPLSQRESSSDVSTVDSATTRYLKLVAAAAAFSLAAFGIKKVVESLPK